MGKVFLRGIVVSMGNQKGGVGKSVITSLVANHLHKYYSKLKIVVIDSDDLQASLTTLRNREIQNLTEKEQKKLYRLLQISSDDIPSQIEILQDEYDIIFIDFPGNLKQAGVITTYYCVDVLFVPTQTSPLDIDSSLKFLDLYEDVITARKQAGLNTAIYGIFNRIDPQNKDFKNLYANRDQFSLKFLDNFIPESKVVFQRNVTTIDTYENPKKDGYADICEEMINNISKFISNGN